MKNYQNRKLIENRRLTLNHDKKTPKFKKIMGADIVKRPLFLCSKRALFKIFGHSTGHKIKFPFLC